MPRRDRLSASDKVIHSIEHETETLVSMRRKRPHAPTSSDESENPTTSFSSDEEDDDRSSCLNHSRLQNWTFGLQITLLTMHFIVSCCSLQMIPKASFLMFFHGVVSPVCFILYFIGFLSITFAVLSIYRRSSLSVTVARQAQWYRRYMRTNKYFLLLWVLSTTTTIFGCWMYHYALHMDETFPVREIYESTKYQLVVKEILIGVQQLSKLLASDGGITSDMEPLKTVKLAGEFYYLAGLIYTVVPGVLLFGCIQYQKKFYAYRFSN